MHLHANEGCRQSGDHNYRKRENKYEGHTLRAYSTKKDPSSMNKMNRHIEPGRYHNFA